MHVRCTASLPSFDGPFDILSSKAHRSDSFFEAKRKSAYDPGAFTAEFVSGIPQAHATLLVSALVIVSSPVAHVQADGYPGSKLAEYFGFWLLTTRRAAGTEDWNSCCARWDDSGRMLEHLFWSWSR